MCRHLATASCSALTLDHHVPPVLLWHQTTPLTSEQGIQWSLSQVDHCLSSELELMSLLIRQDHISAHGFWSLIAGWCLIPAGPMGLMLQLQLTVLELVPVIWNWYQTSWIGDRDNIYYTRVKVCLRILYESSFLLNFYLYWPSIRIPGHLTKVQWREVDKISLRRRRRIMCCWCGTASPGAWRTRRTLFNT